MSCVVVTNNQASCSLIHLNPLHELRPAQAQTVPARNSQLSENQELAEFSQPMTMKDNFTNQENFQKMQFIKHTNKTGKTAYLSKNMGNVFISTPSKHIESLKHPYVISVFVNQLIIFKQHQMIIITTQPLNDVDFLRALKGNHVSWQNIKTNSFPHCRRLTFLSKGLKTVQFLFLHFTLFLTLIQLQFLHQHVSVLCLQVWGRPLSACL